MRRIWLVATWVGATALVSWLTFQALASAEEGVGDSTLRAVVVDAAVDTSTPAPVGDTTLPDTTTSSVPPSSPSSSTSTTTTSTTAPPDRPTTSTTSATTAPMAVPTTTAAPAAWQTRQVASGGGTVTVRYRPGEVEYQAAVPAPGFAVEVDETSPEVRVEFAGEDEDWDVRVRWNDGGLDIDVSD